MSGIGCCSLLLLYFTLDRSTASCSLLCRSSVCCSLLLLPLMLLLCFDRCKSTAGCRLLLPLLCLTRCRSTACYDMLLRQRCARCRFASQRSLMVLGLLLCNLRPACCIRMILSAVHQKDVHLWFLVGVRCSGLCQHMHL